MYKSKYALKETLHHQDYLFYQYNEETLMINVN